MVEQEQLDKMPEVAKDENGQLVAEELKDILERDIKAYEKQLVGLAKDKENYLVQLKLSEELWDLLSKKEDYVKVQPTFKFEENPRYWEIQYELNQYKIRQEKARAQGTLEQIEHETVAITKDYVDKKEKLAKLTEGEKNE